MAKANAQDDDLAYDDLEDDEDMMVDYSEDITDAEPPVPLPIGDYRAVISNVEKRLNQ